MACRRKRKEARRIEDAALIGGTQTQHLGKHTCHSGASGKRCRRTHARGACAEGTPVPMPLMLI